jgi:hypothetical protein
VEEKSACPLFFHVGFFRFRWGAGGMAAWRKSKGFLQYLSIDVAHSSRERGTEHVRVNGRRPQVAFSTDCRDVPGEFLSL